MKVKINKVIPFKDLSLSAVSKTKSEPLTIGKQQYIISPNKLDQKNYTGFPISLQLICTLPDATVDYQYVKFTISAEGIQNKEIVQKRNQKFDDIKKGQQKRDFVFSFMPLKKGSYAIKLEGAYRPRYFTNSNQPADQKKQTMTISLKFEEPFQINEYFVSQDKVNSITFPLLIQHSIQSKLSDQDLTFRITFQSQKFISKFMNVQNMINQQDKQEFTLKNNQTYYTVLNIKPTNIKTFLQQKPQNIGQLLIKYGDKGELRKKINFRTNDKYLFFKGSTIEKTIPKKDIVDVTVKFQKIYNANFLLGDLTIINNEGLMQGIKIVKTSRNKINLDNNRAEDVVFSIICLKSGFYHVKGLTLNTADNKIVNYVNDITLFVQNEREHKTQVFENTSVITIPQEDSLI